MTFSLVTLGSPAVLNPGIRDLRIRDFPPLPRDRFGPSSVWPIDYTALMGRQRSVFVGLSAADGVASGCTHFAPRDARTGEISRNVGDFEAVAQEPFKEIGGRIRPVALLRGGSRRSAAPTNGGFNPDM